MEIIRTIGAQGDILIRRVDSLPKGLTKDTEENPIVAHSETGHHHVAIPTRDCRVERYVKDEMKSYLVIKAKRDELRSKADDAIANIDEALCGAVIEHHRDWDTHETVALPCEDGEAVYEVLRQRESSPEGWRQVAD